MRTVGFILILFISMVPLVFGREDEAKLFAFARFQELISKGLPEAVVLTPEITMRDGSPVTYSDLKVAFISEKEKISEICKCFMEDKREQVKWPEINGREYTLAFVFKGDDPLIKVKVLENAEGVFWVFSDYEESRKEHLNIFKVSGRVSGLIDRNVITPVRSK